MKIKIITPGVLTTVQDLGRPVWRSDGVPLGGAVDTMRHRLANFLTGNGAGAASLEIAGGIFTAHIMQQGWFAVGGTGGQLLIGEKETCFGRLCFAPTGVVLEIRPEQVSNYIYLAVRGGWDVPEVLASRSTCLSAGFGGLEGRSLQKGDILQAAKAETAFELPDKSGSGDVWISQWFVGESFPKKQDNVIRVLPGPEFHWWNEEQRTQFFKTPFIVSSRRDRMGVRLEYPTSQAPPEHDDMLSTAVSPGTVQVPPDGQPFILLADAQTTGGYPRIAQVTAVDIPRLAQIPTGQTVYFQMITLEEAEKLFTEQENLLQKIQLALRWKTNFG